MFRLAVAAQLAAISTRLLAAPAPVEVDGALKGVDMPTGNPMNCTTPTKFFRQLTTHDHPAPYTPELSADLTPTDTFLQQYQVISDFFEPGGPILFFQGAEDPLQCSEGLVSTHESSSWLSCAQIFSTTDLTPTASALLSLPIILFLDMFDVLS